MSRPLVVAFSVLAGLHVVTGGALLADLFGVKAAGAIVLGVAAVDAGLGYYVHNSTTPTAQVAAVETPDGIIVAGPAADQRTGTVAKVVPDLDPQTPNSGPLDPHY